MIEVNAVLERERDFLLDIGFLPTISEYVIRLCPMCDDDLYRVVRTVNERLDSLPPWFADPTEYVLNRT
ncbi:hypothetical protein [Nocardia sp. CNY236]|uniref:hypothetical protein n=1 Tax=Nocardia sp. CNY236 TaxID=1169152 RepID=UPI0003F584FD|nr:hypothetical protein [Nocardia sp. CNY236]